MKTLIETKGLEEELDCEPFLIGIERSYEDCNDVAYEYIYTCDNCNKHYCKHNAYYEEYILENNE